MKKLILFFIALSICVSLVACETTEPDLDNTSEPSNTEAIENTEPNETTDFTCGLTIPICRFGSLKDLEKYIFEKVTDINQYDYPQEINFDLEENLNQSWVEELQNEYISLEYVFGIDEDTFLHAYDGYDNGFKINCVVCNFGPLRWYSNYMKFDVSIGATKHSDILEYLNVYANNINDDRFIEYGEEPKEKSVYAIRSFDGIYVAYLLHRPYTITFIAEGYIISISMRISYTDIESEVVQRFFEDERTAHLGKLFSDNYDEAKEAVDNIITNIRNAKSQKEIVN